MFCGGKEDAIFGGSTNEPSVAWFVTTTMDDIADVQCPERVVVPVPSYMGSLFRIPSRRSHRLAEDISGPSSSKGLSKASSSPGSWNEHGDARRALARMVCAVQDVVHPELKR